MQRPSSAVVSNTMVAEAGRLIQGEEDGDYHFGGGKYNEKRLLDLLSLIEAVCLYEHLITLPSGPSSKKNEHSELFQTLKRARIIDDVAIQDKHQEVGKTIIKTLREVGDFKFVAGSASDMGSVPIEFAGIENEIKGFLEETSRADATSERRLEPPNIFTTIDYSSGGGRSSQMLFEPSFEGFAKQLVGWIEYRQSGAYEFCTSVLRDMYYVFASEALGCSYWPQFSRVHFARRFPNYLEKDIRSKLHSKLSNEFEVAVDELNDTFGSSFHFVPPFAALVLDRCRSVKEIPNATLEVRHEFQHLRADMQQLEDEMRSATTFGEMIAVTKRQKKLLDVLGKRFEYQSRVGVEKAIKFIPDLIKPAVNPTNPTSYGASLILQPIEWLTNAIRNRPLLMYFDLKSKVDAIGDYGGLIAKFPEFERLDLPAGWDGLVEEYGRPRVFSNSDSWDWWRSLEVVDD